MTNKDESKFWTNYKNNIYWVEIGGGLSMGQGVCQYKGWCVVKPFLLVLVLMLAKFK